MRGRPSRARMTQSLPSRRSTAAKPGAGLSNHGGLPNLPEKPGDDMDIAWQNSAQWNTRTYHDQEGQPMTKSIKWAATALLVLLTLLVLSPMALAADPYAGYKRVDITTLGRWPFGMTSGPLLECPGSYLHYD